MGQNSEKESLADTRGLLYAYIMLKLRYKIICLLH